MKLKPKCLICFEPKQIVAGGRCSDCLYVDGPNGRERQYMCQKTSVDEQK